MKALDLFAGTGWGVACKWLGIEEDGVELMPEAVATRTANGMRTIFSDVWDGLFMTKEEFRAKYGKHALYIGSPPCQTFSAAGNGAGRKALDEVITAIEEHLYKDPASLKEFGQKHDDRTALVLTPLAYIWRDMPEFVVLEQVPTVQPVWEAYAVILRDLGYSVETAILNAEQYGVPQTRKRSILVASLHGEAKLPTPTHSRYYPRDPQKLDAGVLPWVSMAEALGWGRTVPSPTYCNSGHGGAGIEWGGNSVRKSMRAQSLTGENWKQKPDVEQGTNDAIRISPDDAATIQSYPPGIYIHPMTNGRRGVWPADGPAPTIRGVNRGMPGTYTGNDRDAASPEEAHPRLSTEEAATLQTYPAGRGMSSRPSPTITGGGVETGGAEPIAKLKRYTESKDWQGGKERLSTDEAATLQSYPAGWGFTERPAMTVTGHGMLTRSPSGQKKAVVDAADAGEYRFRPPFTEETAKKADYKPQESGYLSASEMFHADAVNCSPEENAVLQSYPAALRSNYGTSGDKDNRGERTVDQPAATVTSKVNRNLWVEDTAASGIRVSPDQASVLQSYEEPFIWCGPKSKVYLQIGNAVPPVLAHAVLSALVAPSAPSAPSKPKRQRRKLL